MLTQSIIETQLLTEEDHLFTEVGVVNMSYRVRWTFLKPADTERSFNFWEAVPSSGQGHTLESLWPLFKAGSPLSSTSCKLLEVRSLWFFFHRYKWELKFVPNMVILKIKWVRLCMQQWLRQKASTENQVLLLYCKTDKMLKPPMNSLNSPNLLH